MIHESFDYTEFRNKREQFYGQRIDEAFQQASYIVFCSSISMKLYNGCSFNGNFRMIHNALAPQYRKIEHSVQLKQSIRAGFNLNEEDLLFINIGTIVEHKNQALIVEAAALLKDRNIKIFLLGAIGEVTYYQRVRKLTEACQVTDVVKIFPETRDVGPYYLAADAFVFTSTNETYPLVILEAMAYGLPIITTPVNGVNEQVRFDFNALKTGNSDPAELAGNIIRLAEDRRLREEMGRNSLIVFESLEPFEEMINEHEQLLLSALKTHHAAC